VYVTTPLEYEDSYIGYCLGVRFYSRGHNQTMSAMESVKPYSRPTNGPLVNGTGVHESRNPTGLTKISGNDVYGKRLLPMVADMLARTNPQKVHASIAVSADLSDGFRDVTISQMVNCANHMEDPGALWQEYLLRDCFLSWDIRSQVLNNGDRHDEMWLQGWVLNAGGSTLLTKIAFRSWSPPFATHSL
jgi:hypothetical protein